MFRQYFIAYPFSRHNTVINQIIILFSASFPVQLSQVDAMVGIPAAARPTHARRMKGTVIEMLTARALSSVDKITAQTQQASIPPTTAAKQVLIFLVLYNF